MEQAWIQKMAREIARKVNEERVRLKQADAGGKEEKGIEVGSGNNEAELDRMSPPPAYGAV